MRSTGLHRKREMQAQRVERARGRRSGFTLVEILVALTVLMIMLIIILVPVNMGLKTFHIGRARANVQQASLATLSQIERDLKRAVFVFPNSRTAGITDAAPYNTSNLTFDSFPYMQVYLDPGTNPTINLYFNYNDGICSLNSTANDAPVDNLSRIDMILPKTDANGAVTNPVEPGYDIVTYYARRLRTDQLFDVYMNPIVLYRAQMPYLDSSGNAQTNPLTPVGAIAPVNVDTSASRYPDPSSAKCTAARQLTNRQCMWLTQNQMGEPDLEPLTDIGDVTRGSHTLAIPRDMALWSPDFTPLTLSPSDYIPNTAFACFDSNGDNRIDRVLITLELAQFDSASAGVENGKAAAQHLRVTRDVLLPNVR